MCTPELRGEKSLFYILNYLDFPIVQLPGNPYFFIIYNYLDVYLVP